MRLTLGVRDMDILRSFCRTLGWPEPNGDTLLGMSCCIISCLGASSNPTLFSGALVPCLRVNRCHKARRGDVNV